MAIVADGDDGRAHTRSGARLRAPLCRPTSGRGRARRRAAQLLAGDPRRWQTPRALCWPPRPHASQLQGTTDDGAVYAARDDSTRDRGRHGSLRARGASPATTSGPHSPRWAAKPGPNEAPVACTGRRGPGAHRRRSGDVFGAIEPFERPICGLEIPQIADILALERKPRPNPLLASALHQIPPGKTGGRMTKNEFVDRVAAESGLSKKDAGSAVDAVIKSIESRSRCRRGGQLHRFRKVPRRRAWRPRGSQPAHRRDDDDRRQQGPALHGGLRPQEGRQVTRHEGRRCTTAGARPGAPSAR